MDTALGSLTDDNGLTRLLIAEQFCDFLLEDLGVAANVVGLGNEKEKQIGTRLEVNKTQIPEMTSD